MPPREKRRKLMESLISEIQIYKERQANGQWLKSITFRLQIIDGKMKMPAGDGLDNDIHVETCALLVRELVHDYEMVSIKVDMAGTSL